MKTKGVVGQRIVEIRQRRREGRSEVLEIVLENGRLLRPTVRELENDYAVDFIVVK